MCFAFLRQAAETLAATGQALEAQQKHYEKMLQKAEATSQKLKEIEKKVENLQNNLQNHTRGPAVGFPDRYAEYKAAREVLSKRKT